MAKQRTAFDHALPPRPASIPAYRWLYEGLRSGILEGRLRAHTKLPSTRDFAEQYRLSRGTVVVAFDQLKAEGYLEGMVGSGTYVSRILPEDRFHTAADTERMRSERQFQKHRLSDYGKRVKVLPGLTPRPTRAFRPNLPAIDLFPTALWAQGIARRVKDASTYLLLGCEPMGYGPLREAVANYLSTSRAVLCTAAQIMIVSGTQEALDLSARVLLDPGDSVCMEDPGYSGASLIFEAAGAKVSAIPLDQEGMKIPRTSSLRKLRMVYVTPGHQFPTGITMSLARRLELLNWAQKAGAIIFEDDYDSEYRYSGRPVPALQGLSQSNQVIFSGSFSKVLFPSLRLGYLVLPVDLVPAFTAAKSVINRHSPVLEQAVLCDFIREGHFARHLRRMRQVYAERYAAVLEAAEQKLKGLLEISGVEAGLQTAGWLQQGINADAAVEAAAARGIELLSLNRFWRLPVLRQGLVLGFAAIDVPEIRRGVRELGIALKSILRKND